MVIGRTFQEHLLNLRKVWQRFREARLKLNPKCQVFQKEVWWCLGHVVTLGDNRQPREAESHTGMVDPVEQT